MNIVDLNDLDGRRYPAGRLTKSVVGAGRNIECRDFCMGVVSLDPDGGQVPWHNHANEEVYFVLDGELQLALGDEIANVSAGQTVHIPSGVYHQLTNLGGCTARFVYVYGPAGDVDHWRQELEGTLPRAGVDAPPMPVGAAEQRI